MPFAYLLENCEPRFSIIYLKGFSFIGEFDSDVNELFYTTIGVIHWVKWEPHAPHMHGGAAARLLYRNGLVGVE
jgi:hypothetical protein